LLKQLKDEFLAARQALKDLYMPQFEAFEAEIAAKEAELLVLQEQLAAKQAELVEALRRK